MEARPQLQLAHAQPAHHLLHLREALGEGGRVVGESLDEGRPVQLAEDAEDEGEVAALGHPVRVRDHDTRCQRCGHALAQQVHHEDSLRDRQHATRKVELHPLLGGALVVDDGWRGDTARGALLQQLLLVLLGRVQEENQVLRA